MIVLHGLFGSGRNWHTIANRLADCYRVIAIDLRNHGESPWSPVMDFPSMADDLAALIAAKQLDRAVILGHSLGGKTAMLFSLRDPALVEALVVVDIAPVRYRHSFLDYVQAMQALDLRQIRRRGEAEQALAEGVQDASLRKFLVQNLATGPHGLVWKVNLRAIADAMPQLLDFPYTADWEYDGRVLFVSGARSDYIAPQHQRRIFALFPQAEFAVIENAGHRVHADQPDLFVDRVLEFLESAQV
jgi:pimeloyl-ACP methyl ester carboxylesterase